MGYRTDYGLGIQPEGVLTEETMSKLEEAFDPLNIPLKWLLDGACEDMKWYGHESDMQKISEEFPTLLFILDGEGEDAGDVWRKFFWQGNYERVEQPEWKRPERPKGWTAKDEESLRVDAENQVLADQVAAQKVALAHIAKQLEDRPDLKAELRKILEP